jgi:putative amide transporter protein
MLSGLILFYVGAVLILNGLWMLGHIADREVFVINLLVGLLALRVAHEFAFGAGATALSIRDAALTLLFAFTYLWSAYNKVVPNDGRGLGWFSLFVAVNAMAVGVGLAMGANDVWSIMDAVSWIAWSVLWLLFFLLLVCKKPWERFTGWMAIVQGVFTGFLPGYLLLGI